MYQFIEDTLSAFRECFSNSRTYCWFIILVIGFILRDDVLGVTSVIRALMLDASCYEPMLHFFYSNAWGLDSIRETWFGIVADSGLVYKVDGRCVLAGDGVKASKEAFRMPGVKKLFQESEDSSKGVFIFGHMFGAVGAILEKGSEMFCVPLRMSIQEGLSAAASWEGSEIPSEGHVQQIIRNGFQVANRLGSSILVLDRLFLTTQAIRTVRDLNASGKYNRLELVTKAKRNCKAYEKPPARRKGQRGAPRKKGDVVPLWDLFDDLSSFKKSTVTIYNEKKTVDYLCMDLLWGLKLYQELRFVLVTYDGKKSILVSTDTGLSPEQVIELYSRRFRIENCFREFKQQIGGFGYHFWTRALGKLNHFKKKEEPDPIELVEKKEDRDKILGKIRAIEGFVQLCCISMGLVQIMSLREKENPEMQSARYLRTRRRESLSEASMLSLLRKQFFVLSLSSPDSPITRVIQGARNYQKRSKKTGKVS